MLTTNCPALGPNFVTTSAFCDLRSVRVFFFLVFLNCCFLVHLKMVPLLEGFSEIKFKPQPSKLYFQGFRGSKLLNGCLAVWPNNLCARNTVIFRIQNWYLWSAIVKFSCYCFWEIWIFVYCWFNSYFTFITKEKFLCLRISLICSFCCLLIEGLAVRHSRTSCLYMYVKKSVIRESLNGNFVLRFDEIKEITFIRELDFHVKQYIYKGSP